MLNQSNQTFIHWREKGQSLVETALFLPIFLVILAGVVEVSQYVITNNRLTTAARASTRFAANGGEDAGMATVMQTTVTQTMDLDPQIWNVFSIRGTINSAGDDFSEFDVQYIYGALTETISITAMIDEDALKQQILKDLKFDEEGNPITNLTQELGDVQIVGTYIFHDMKSLLNLDATAGLASIYTIDTLSVMRLTGFIQQPSEGCSAFPIAVKEGVRAVTPPGTGANPYPAAAEFDYPVVAPRYFQFVRHDPAGILNDDAQEGTLFRFIRGTDPQPFYWLSWNDLVTPDPAVLANSLKWPGDSLDYSNHGDTGIVHPDFGYVVRGYAEPGNVKDIELHRDNVVRISAFQLDTDVTFGTVNQSLNENISRGRDLRFIVFNDSGDDTAGEIKIGRFGVFTVRGYGNTGGNEWLLTEFVRWDDTCGNIAEVP